MTTSNQTSTKSKDQPQKQLSISNPKSKHYVDNEKFLSALVQYKNEVKDAEENNKDKPLVSNYLG